MLHGRLWFAFNVGSSRAEDKPRNPMIWAQLSTPQSTSWPSVANVLTLPVPEFPQV